MSRLTLTFLPPMAAPLHYALAHFSFWHAHLGAQDTPSFVQGSKYTGFAFAFEILYSLHVIAEAASHKVRDLRLCS